MPQALGSDEARAGADYWRRAGWRRRCSICRPTAPVRSAKITQALPPKFNERLAAGLKALSLRRGNPYS